MRVIVLLLCVFVAGCDALRGPKGDKGDSGSDGSSGTQTSVFTGNVPADGIINLGNPPLATNTGVQVWLNPDPSGLPNTWLLVPGIPDETDNSPWCAVNYSTAKVGLYNASTSMTYKIILIKPTYAPSRINQLIYG